MLPMKKPQTQRNPDAPKEAVSKEETPPKKETQKTGQQNINSRNFCQEKKRQKLLKFFAEPTEAPKTSFLHLPRL